MLIADFEVATPAERDDKLSKALNIARAKAELQGKAGILVTTISADSPSPLLPSYPTVSSTNAITRNADQNQRTADTGAGAIFFSGTTPSLNLRVWGFPRMRQGATRLRALRGWSTTAA